MDDGQILQALAAVYSVCPERRVDHDAVTYSKSQIQDIGQVYEEFLNLEGLVSRYMDASADKNEQRCQRRYSHICVQQLQL